MKIIHNKQTLTVVHEGKIIQFFMDNPFIEDILKAIEDNNFIAVQAFKNLTDSIVNGTAVISSEGIQVGDILIENKNKDFGGNKVLQFINKLSNDGIDENQIEYIKPFIDNMFANPYIDAVDELYDFCEAQDFVITEDGCFLAYKAVNPNFTSIHDSKTMHTVGTVVTESAFDTDRNQTCSKGLHFCAKGYLKHFKRHNSIIIVVKVNPKNVVAIPNDYNNMKGRCKEYEVMGVLEEDNLKAYYRNRHV